MRTTWLTKLLLLTGIAAGALIAAPAGAQQTVIVPVGDVWFCDPSYFDGVCPTEIEAGDTVRWDFSDALVPHSTTACGADCDDPDPTPLWDSGVNDPFSPSRIFEYTFTTPGIYPYYCTEHPAIHRGVIIVGQPPLVGDANCNDVVNAIDAQLVLQFGAGLLASLLCQENADANRDGVVNAVDATLILQYDAGLLQQLPP